MAITSGDFTATQIREAILNADDMWANDMMKADFEAQVDVWKAIKAEQNANVRLLEDGEKDRDVKIVWANLCNEVAEDCDGDDCDLEGVQMGTDSKTYGLGLCKQWKLRVDENMFRTQDNVTFEEIVAKGMLKADKILSEAITASGMARLESFKGTNVVTNGLGTINVGTTETDIPSADWNERLFPHLYRIGLQNQFSNPFLLSGTNLWEDYIAANLNGLNADGKGAAAMYKMIRTYFDLFNIDPAVAPSLKTYMINRGAVAFASKSYYKDRPRTYKQQDRFAMASRNLEGVYIDVHYTNLCSGNTIMHDFQFKVYYDYFLNPTGCDAGRTGVLAFNRV